MTTKKPPTELYQLTAEDVKRLSKAGEHDRIEQARRDGHLSALLGTAPHPEDAPAGEQINAEQVHRMYTAQQYEQIEAARKAGLLTDLLGGDAA
jgi:hypothetical protein